jgi:hypothetical protein
MFLVQRFSPYNCFSRGIFSIPGISTRAMVSICTSGRLLPQGQHAALKLIAEMNSRYGVQFLKTVPSDGYWNW